MSPTGELGLNSDGQRDPPPGLSDVIAVSAGSHHSAALKADGTVMCWGLGSQTYLKPPEDLTDVIAIAAGCIHNVALRQDGTVACWGSNEYNESLPPSGLNGVVAVAAGNYQSAALRSDGTVACWGKTGQSLVPAEATNVVRIAVGESRVLALCEDGRILSWGYGYDTETIWVGPGVLDLSCGGPHAMALLAADTDPTDPDSNGVPHLSFDAQGGSVDPDRVTVTFGAAYGDLPVPGRIGYDFGGWWTAAGEGGAEVTGNMTVNSILDHTLYARWAAKAYVVAFDPWCGSVSPAGKAVAFGGAYGLLPTPARDGYSFEGWWTGPHASGACVVDGTLVSVAADHTLYAEWAPLQSGDQAAEFLYDWTHGSHTKDGFPDPGTGKIYLAQDIEWSDLVGGDPEGGVALDVGPGQTHNVCDPRTHEFAWGDTTGDGWPRGSPDPFQTVCYEVGSYDDPPNLVEPDPAGAHWVSNTLSDEYTDGLLWQIVNENLQGLDGFEPSIDKTIPCGLGDLHINDEHDWAWKRNGQYKFWFDPSADNVTLYWCEQFVPDGAPDQAVYTKRTWSGSGTESPVFYVDPDASGGFGTHWVYFVDVDLDLASSEDRLEETRGGVVALRRDGEEADTCLIEAGFKPVRFESPSVRGTLTLEAVSGGGKVSLRTDTGEAVTLPKTWNLGERTDPYYQARMGFYVEGVGASETANDVELRLWCALGGAVWEDTVRLSVVDVSLTPDYDRDGAVDDADRGRAEAQEPLVVAVGAANGVALAPALRPVDLACGQVRLSVQADGAGRAEVRDGAGALVAGRESPKSWTLSTSEPASSLPADLAVFGTQASSEPGDAVLKLEYLSPEGAVTCCDTVRVTVVRMALAPDYNRDGIIDEEDRFRASTNEVFRFWINDDKDVGDVAVGDSDEPGQSNGNFSNGDVNGRCDLLDFFPVHVDVSSPLGLFSGYDNVSYRLSQADSAVNVVWTGLASGDAGLFQKAPTNTCGQTLDEPSYSAQVTPVTAQGVTLPPLFLLAIIDIPACGVIQLEGRAPTSSPLVLEILRNGSAICRVELPLLVKPVEEMFVRVNLRGGGAAVVTPGSAMPPDNGKNVVFLHGFNVTPEQASAWHSELFKRLWQSGSNARFHGVTWRGDIGLVNGFHYHENAVLAFETALHLADYVEGLLGQNVVMAHSLGNMVASAAIADHDMSVSKYFMFNAAVPAEAYDPSLWSAAVSGNNMVHVDWIDYLPRTWSALYHRLFDPNIVFGNDDRYTLTWKGRFSACLPGLYNYYSSGDEVFEQYVGTPLPTEGLSWHLGVPVVTGTERYSWQKQELYKGRDGMGEWSGLFGTEFAGWGFELVSLMGEDPHPVYAAADANAFSETELADPLYVSFRRTPACMFANPIMAADRFALLAKAVPALSGATGNTQLSTITDNGHQIDMNTVFHHPNWPRTEGDYGTRWLHSDIKDLAFFYIAPLFDDVVLKEELK